MSAAREFAKRLFTKYNLTIPVDLEKIIDIYADLAYIPFPDESDGIDGVTLDLKVFGKRPKIFINEGKPKTRQLFTLAHELGHVIIPWHTGAIIDNISPNDEDSTYQQCENEADEFASELLLPSDWIQKKLEDLHSLDDLKIILEEIANLSGLSYAAIGFKIINFLPPNYIYVYTKNNRIISHQKSKSTLETLKFDDRKKLLNDTDFFKKYVDSKKYFVIEAGDYSYYWFALVDKIEILTYDHDKRSAKEILQTIVNDLGRSHHDLLSINGMFGSAKSMLSHNNHLTLELLYPYCLTKIKEDKYSWIREHKDFPIFLSKKVFLILNSN